MTLHTLPSNTIEKDSENFYISYNGSSASYGCNTTALVLKKPLLFLILGGDHREGTKNIISFNECIEYYKNNYKYSNYHSESRFLIDHPDYIDIGKLIQTLGPETVLNFKDFLLSRK